MSDADLQKLIDSNAKSIQALTNTVSDAVRQLAAQMAESNRQQTESNRQLSVQIAETNRQLAESNRQQAERMDWLTDAIAESNRNLTAQIADLADCFGILTRIVSDHESDNQRHNQPTE